MSIPTDPNAEAQRPPTSTPSPTSGPDSVTSDETKHSSTDYIYYRIYSEDGGIPSKTSVTPDDRFLGRIKARSVPPPQILRAVKLTIAKAEDINLNDPTTIDLFHTSHSESPLSGDGRLINTLIVNSQRSTPQEPLALVAKMSDSERSSLESAREGGLAESNATSPGVRYLYYQVYANNSDIPSKVAFNPDEPSLGRIRADSVTPPHSLASIRRRISRVEENPALVHAHIYADISTDIPLKEGPISIHGTDGPGLSPNEPMAIVQPESPIPDGRYVIKNLDTEMCWNGAGEPMKSVCFYVGGPEPAAQRIEMNIKSKNLQWDITHDCNGDISIKSVGSPIYWAGVDLAESRVPVPWRLILGDKNFYYLTTDVNQDSQNPQVPAVKRNCPDNGPGTMATLKWGDSLQLWEFIHVSPNTKSI